MRGEISNAHLAESPMPSIFTPIVSYPGGVCQGDAPICAEGELGCTIRTNWPNAFPTEGGKHYHGGDDCRERAH